MTCSVYHLFTTYVPFACAKNQELSCHGAVLWLGKVWRQVQAWAETQGSEWISRPARFRVLMLSVACCREQGGVSSGFEQLSAWHTVQGRDRHTVRLQQTPRRWLLWLLWKALCWVSSRPAVLSAGTAPLFSDIIRATYWRWDLHLWAGFYRWWRVLCPVGLVTIRVMSSPINSRQERSVVIVVKCPAGAPSEADSPSSCSAVTET